MQRHGDIGVRTCTLVLLAAVTLLFVPFPGTSDVSSFWLPWMHNLDSLGLVRGYAVSRSDYPPGSAIVLMIAVRLGAQLGLDHFTALKWSLLIFLSGSSLLFWLWTRRFALTVCLHLALLLETVALGYIDIYFAPWLIGALWALQQRRLVTFAVCFTVACLTKWQPSLLAPFVLVHLAGIDDVRQWRSVPWFTLGVRIVVPATAITVAALRIFGQPVLESLERARSHKFLSGDALNFCWMITHWVRAAHPEVFGGLTNRQADFISTGDLHYTLLPKILFWGFYVAALIATFRAPKTFPRLLAFALIGYLAYFTFNTGVHENHLFLAVIVVFILYWQDGSQAAAAMAVVLLANLNLILFYGIDGGGYRFSRVVAGIDLALPLSALAVAFFLITFGRVVIGTWAGKGQA